MPAALAVMLLCARASAKIYVWTNPNGGSASTLTNWNPITGAPPNIDDTVQFTLTNTYTVTFDQDVFQVQTHEYDGGNVTLNITFPHQIQSFSVTDEDAGSADATVTLTTGSVSVDGALLIGHDGFHASRTGRLNINDVDASMSCGFASIGFLNNGILSITNGGNLTATGLLTGGTSDTSSTLIVTGMASGQPPTPSTLTVGAGTTMNPIPIIGRSGTATVTVSGGALAHFLGDLSLGYGPTASATVTVHTLGLSNTQARLTVDGDLGVGNSLDNNPAGAATLIAQSGGNVHVGGTIFVGDPASGSGGGTLRITTGGLVSAHDLICTNTGAALDLQAGTLQINGGTFDPPGSVNSFTLSSSVGTPIVQFNNGASVTFTASCATCNALVMGTGSTAQGQLQIHTNSAAHITQGLIVLGNSAGSTGTLTIDGGGALNTPSILRVGSSGAGQVTATSPATALVQVMELGASPGSSGMYQASGSGAVLTVNSTLSIGGVSVGAGGTGSFSIDSSAPANIGGTTRIWPAGTLHIGSGSVFTAAGAVTSDNLIQLAGGTLTCNNTTGLTLNSGSAVTGSGTIDSNVNAAFGHFTATSNGIMFTRNVTRTSTGGAWDGTRYTFANGCTFTGQGSIAAEFIANPGSTITANGDLHVGNPSSVNGVAISGTLDAGTHAVTFDDLNGVSLGALTVLGAGGSISETHALTLPGPVATHELRGVGTVQGTLLIEKTMLLIPVRVPWVQDSSYLGSAGMGLSFRWIADQSIRISMQDRGIGIAARNAPRHAHGERRLRPRLRTIRKRG